MAFHFPSLCMVASLTFLASFAGFGHVHSGCALNVIPSVRLLQCACSCPSFYSIQSRRAPRDRRRFRVRAHCICSLLALTHFSLFVFTNSLSFKISSAFLTPPISAAFNSSARSPCIPDTAGLTRERFDIIESSRSTAGAATVSQSQRFGVHLVAVESAADVPHAVVVAAASADAAVAPPAAAVESAPSFSADAPPAARTFAYHVK